MRPWRPHASLGGGQILLSLQGAQGHVRWAHSSVYEPNSSQVGMRFRITPPELLSPRAPSVLASIPLSPHRFCTPASLLAPPWPLPALPALLPNPFFSGH